MNFDTTYIAIRKRNLLEIIDLALHVIRDHFSKLAVLWLVGTIPFFVLNHLMIGWMSTEYYFTDYLPAYIWLMVLLVSIESQLATSFISMYLGQAIFEGRPKIWDTVKSVFRSCAYFTMIQMLSRMVLPVIVLVVLLCNVSVDDDTLGWGIFWVTAAAAIGLTVRAIRPFPAEVLLLEKTPIRANEGQIHYRKRSGALHGNAASELFGRFFLVLILSAPLAFMFYSVLLTTDNLFNLHFGDEQTMVRFYWPVALWIVSGLFGVVRFLSYIDIRIRQEGWAVELRVRAEALRMQKNLEQAF